MRGYTSKIVGDCEALALAIDRALGFPARGIQHGIGIHVRPTRVWDPNRPIGWTGPTPIHRRGSDFAVMIDDALEVSLRAARKSPADRTEIEAKLAAAKQLGEDWNR